MEQQFNTEVTTGKVRLSYVHLFKPVAAQGATEEKYSTTILIPKSDTETIQKISVAIQAAAQKGVANAWGGVMPKIFKNPLKDGDGVRPSDGEEYGPECKGHYILTASAKAEYPPEVVDQQLNHILDQSEIYSGCYARVNVNFFPYGGGTTGYAKGVGAGLGPVQKLADGEPLGGGVKKASSVFGVVETPQEDATAINPITGQPY